MTRTTSYHHDHHNNDAFVSPRAAAPEGKLRSSMGSPRTITLGNQTEAILRGMTSNAMLMSANKKELFTQTAATPRQQQLPLLPCMKTLSVSRPIRIARRKPAELQLKYHHNTGEDLLSASPSELKLMYDEATWRMYHLIQTARLEKQAAKAAEAAAAAPAQGAWPAVTNDKYLYDDSFFLEPTSPPCAATLMGLPVVSPEDDIEQDDHGAAASEEGVFELDDL